MVSFEIFVKAMPPSLSELKVLPSFCFAFKIPDDVTASNNYSCIHHHSKKYIYCVRVYVLPYKICNVNLLRAKNLQKHVKMCKTCISSTHLSKKRAKMCKIVQKRAKTCISNIFGPNSKTCTCEVRAA